MPLQLSSTAQKIKLSSHCININKVNIVRYLKYSAPKNLLFAGFYCPNPKDCYHHKLICNGFDIPYKLTCYCFTILKQYKMSTWELPVSSKQIDYIIICVLEIKDFCSIITNIHHTSKSFSNIQSWLCLAC